MELKRLGLACALLLLAQLLLVECETQKEGKKAGKEGKKDREGKENPTDDGSQRIAKKEEKKPGASEHSERGQRAKGGKGAPTGGKVAPKGKFPTKEKAECSWAVSEAGTISLQVECAQGSNNFSCAFAGNPSACPQYSANPKSYWKQITRALKRQKDICQDPKALLKAKDCKRGPHLSLQSSTLLETAPAAQEGKESSRRVKKVPKNAAAPTSPAPTSARPAGASESSKACVEDTESVDQKKLAEEYCGGTWGSLCAFFISMVQNQNC